MKTKSLIVIGILLLVVSTTQAALIPYDGTITYSGGGITGIDGSSWLNDDTSLTWAVTDNLNGTWTYKYTLDVGDDPAISHFILEVSDNFEEDDYLSGPQGDLDTYSSAQGSSNPGIPGSVYGIKWGGQTDTDWELEFTTTKAPTWGDFYAKGGRTGIWNLGFTSPDSDSASQIGGDGEWDHIVVPDTVTTPTTSTTPSAPAPAAVLLSALGTCTVTWLRRLKAI